jgi:hypothetical protein
LWNDLNGSAVGNESGARRDNAFSGLKPILNNEHVAQGFAQLDFAHSRHRIDAQQNLRLKFVYERYRQENYGAGGVVDESAGRSLNRNNWNLTGTHSWTPGDSTLNQLSVHTGRRRFEEPNNSQSVGEYFSSGNTLQTGANILGDRRSIGDIVELRETFARRLGSGRWAADLKIGAAVQHFTDFLDFPLFPHGLLIYLDDTRLAPLLYAAASGASEDTLRTNLMSAFVQSNFRPGTGVALNIGLRYDLDTNGNNPGFTSPLMPAPRGRDTNNFQPRGGLSWDVGRNGRHVIRGGAGLFAGRFLLTPAHIERMRNGFTGLIVQQRLSGIAIGAPTLALDPATPSTTGIALPRDASRNADSFVSPYSKQVTAGYTIQLGSSGLFTDFEGVYVRGRSEVINSRFELDG